MSIKEQLDSDIYAFFTNIENQTDDDKRKTLLILMDKYVHLFTTPVLLDKHDFEMIRSHAIKFLVDRSFPKYIKGGNYGPREITGSESTALSIIEATITVLNSKECFKKLPKFDYKE